MKTSFNERFDPWAALVFFSAQAKKAGDPMAKMVHSDPNSAVKHISNQGREYTANDAGEFDVDDRDVGGMKRFGLVEKGQAGK